ncbi:MAG TPA: hypothetical protein VF427_07940 [Noviherbaspirillum sp.]
MEYEDVLGRIAAFVQDYGNRLEPPMLNATKKQVKDDFDVLKEHLFGSYFGRRTQEMYGMGKELFHAFDSLLKNEKISLSQRMDAVVALAPRARVCAGGLLSDLQSTIIKLQLSNSGLKGAAYRRKIKMLDDLILQYVTATHVRGNNPGCTPGMEIHYAYTGARWPAGAIRHFLNCSERHQRGPSQDGGGFVVAQGQGRGTQRAHGASLARGCSEKAA